MSDLEIAIVTRNRPEILDDTLNTIDELGLINQVLVVDGSDGDLTKKKCHKYNLFYCRQESSGMTAARNEALKHTNKSYIAFIDDDVKVSDSWYNTIESELKKEGIVGATGKLEDENLVLGSLAKKVRAFMFGSEEIFGEILDNGVTNGDFFYEKRKEVDHMPGCNMAFDVEALRRQGGFDEEFDVGSSYGEDTAASLRVAREGKIVYEPEASLKHLKVGENRDENRRVFFDAYNTRFLQKKYDLVDGFSRLLRNLGVTTLRHIYYLISSVSSSSPSRFVSYFKGDVLGLWDFWLRDRKPSDRF